MSQIIAINVKEKIASTDFREVVSFNSVYELNFTFDSEWTEFDVRVAVVLWPGGCAEKTFTGTACEMPAVAAPDDCDSVLVGVYSISGEKKIASTFVRLSCLAGAHGMPSHKEAQSLHEQILALVNEKDWSVFEEKVAEGVYTAVSVNQTGLVTKGWKSVEIGEDGQTEPSDDLAVGGVFFLRTGTYYTPYYKSESGLVALTSPAGESSNCALTIGSKTYDGSEEVEVTASDLGLSDVATSGSYSDLTDTPTSISMADVYPVGSVYISTANTSPAAMFGGAWEQITGKFLVSTGTSYSAGSTGGSSTHRHDFKMALPYLNGTVPGDGFTQAFGAYRYSSGSYPLGTQVTTGTTITKTNSVLTESGIVDCNTASVWSSTGDTSATSNIPPYLCVYMWKRTM